ncbi:serine hydrolase [Nafulsella turpanensis]|uniref:serine hydrolase n=1 Tax=Nafulsella turpanensis TaxID=1265690 RepID=UPI000376C121|nr:serine hydrolase [Nafulsella turpanensis]
MSLAKKVLQLRKEKGYSQEELANKANISLRTLQRIEKGESEPRGHTLRAIAEVLEVSVEELMDFTKKEDRGFLQLMSLSALSYWFMPLLNVLVPMALWLFKRDKIQGVDKLGRQIIVFQLIWSVITYGCLIGFAMFKILHWPAGNAVLFTGLFLYGANVVFIMYTIVRLRNGRQVKKIVSLVFILILAAYPAESQVMRIDGSKIEEKEITERIKSLMKSAEVSGLGISIFNNNKIVYQRAFGYGNVATKDPLSRNSIFYGASLSKAVFANLVMQLVEEGKINLDTPLQDYLDKPLPEYTFQKSWRGYNDLQEDRRYEKITARMCLTHTTGFPNWRFLTNSGFDTEGKLYFRIEPGTRYSYSGEGFALLQFVVEQIMGQGLEEMAQERIFEPLGMDNTSYIYVWQEGMESRYAYGHDEHQNVLPKDEADEAGAAGSLGTTLSDYSKFLEAVLNQELLEKSSIQEMFKKQISISSKQQFGPNAFIDTHENKDIDLGYGLGWGLLTSPHGLGAFKEGHSEGYQHYSILFPNTGTGVLMMTNSNNGESIFKELLELTIADVYTPWQWENYIPFNEKEK